MAALRAAHPYEEPAFDLLELADLPSSRGLGRIGTLPDAEPLAAFTERVAAAPARHRVGRARRRATRTGPIRRVAVCGGAGDSALGAAVAAGVDAYVTADLRHHPASEHLLAGTRSERGHARPGRRRALGVGVAVVRAGRRRRARGAGR